MPTHVAISADKTRIEKDSVILLEQIRTIDKQRLHDRVDHLSDKFMKRVDESLKLSIGVQ